MLKTKFLGRNFEEYEKIDSTQLEIWRRIEKQKIQNGSLISSKIQTAGKGTHGRIWYTDEENNIAFSFYIKTNCDISNLDGMTIEVAETILEVFEKLYNIKLQIKIPNDIVLNGKKLGGILCETKLIGESVKAIVIGIGINTNKQSFISDIKESASSIKKEFGLDINDKKVIYEFCNLFERKILKRIGEN